MHTSYLTFKIGDKGEGHPMTSMQAQTGGRSIALGGYDQHKAPDTLPPAKIWYSLYRRLGGPQGQCGRVQQIPFPLRFNPQTIQPVASCSTDYAIPATQSSRSQEFSQTCLSTGTGSDGCTCTHMNIWPSTQRFLTTLTPVQKQTN